MDTFKAKDQGAPSRYKTNGQHHWTTSMNSTNGQHQGTTFMDAGTEHTTLVKSRGRVKSPLRKGKVAETIKRQNQGTASMENTKG
jgi:hypothetical protein